MRWIMETSLGLGGRDFASIMKITIMEMSERVRIDELIWGRVLPMTVRAKVGFKRGGRKAPMVMANQLTGQRK